MIDGISENSLLGPLVPRDVLHQILEEYWGNARLADIARATR